MKLEELPVKYEKRLVLQEFKDLTKRLLDAGIDPTIDRWSVGTPHNPKAEELAQQIGAIDFVFFGDSFHLNFGGDGDNGETLTYILDVLFDLVDKELAFEKGEQS